MDILVDGLDFLALKTDIPFESLIWLSGKLKKKIAKNCEKLINCEKLRKIAKIANINPPPYVHAPHEGGRAHL